jgi:phosphomannomutase
MSIENPRIVALFDVDGTLTIPRGEITEEMMAFLKELSKKVTVGIVGGTNRCRVEDGVTMLNRI